MYAGTFDIFTKLLIIHSLTYLLIYSAFVKALSIREILLSQNTERLAHFSSTSTIIYSVRILTDLYTNNVSCV